MTTPGRDARRVERNLAEYRNRATIFDDIFAERHVIKLLQAERAALRRMIMKMPCAISQRGPGRPCESNNKKSCTIKRHDLLAALRGKR